MKVIRSGLGVFVLAIVLLSIGTNFSACKKTVYVHDTVTNTIHKTDTVKIVDSSICNCSLTDSLVAWYNFNNGTLKDSSGKGNHITFSNATKTTDRFGRANNAYLFDGTSSYMQVPNSATLNPKGLITIMAIVKMNGFYGGACHGNQILQKGTVDQMPGVYSLRVSDVINDCAVKADTTKETALGFYGDYGAASGANNAADYTHTGKWMTFVYTYDGVQSRFYVDGVLKGLSNTTAVFTPNTNDLFIGRAESNIYPYFWNGAIDEIRIYNRALCEKAVQQLSKLTN